jgi:signal transduction histidine kinase
MFYRPGLIKVKYYLIAEFLLSGSMFLFQISEFYKAGPDILDVIILPLITIAFVSQSKPLIWISPLISLAIIMTGTFIGHFISDIRILGRVADIFIFYGFGFVLGKITKMNNYRKELIDSIQMKNNTLEQYAKRIEELTIIEERNRVSQDLHDTVGHIFTSVITSLDALPFLIKGNKEEAEIYIKEISNLARKGLDDVRNTIHQLSPIEEEQSLVEMFTSIIEDYIKHTGTKVDLEINGHEREIVERIKYTLTRCLQESLTNAKRHGLATHILIDIEFTCHAIVLEIKDNGIGSKKIKPGFGLNSMNDRLLSIGGTFQIVSSIKHGTKITCKIPLPKEEIII